MPTTQQTIEQKRANRAWQAIKEVKKKEREKYVSIVRKAPSYILTNGLGQTLAFLRAKSEAERTLYGHLEAWLKSRLGINKGVMEWLGETDSTTYRRATVEALAYLTWLQRFAEAPEFGAEETE